MKKMKLSSRILSLMAVLLMLLQIIPQSVFPTTLAVKAAEKAELIELEQSLAVDYDPNEGIIKFPPLSIVSKIICINSADWSSTFPCNLLPYVDSIFTGKL